MAHWAGATASSPSSDRAPQLPGDPHALAREVIEASGWITPGLVDCHTHLVFAGDRAREFELRLQGASYEEIARAGGGIVSTVRATREADEAELLRQSLPRARALLADGATTLEIKSGYGLDFDNERKMLRVARQLGAQLGITVRTTYLAAHALAAGVQGSTPTSTSAPFASGCRGCTRTAWSMPSMPSAKASASRRSRRGGCSTWHARWDCR